MNVKKYLALEFLFLVLSAISANGHAMPIPTVSTFMHTEVGAFEINKRKRNLNYILVLRVYETLPRPAYLSVEYENPVDKSAPLFSYHKLGKRDKKIDIKSPPVSNAQNFHEYRVLIKIYSDKKRTKEIGSHEQYIQFIIPPN